MDATFELISPSGKARPEIDFDPASEDFAQMVEDMMPLYGVLILSNDGGSTSITDDFDAMMLELCVNSVGQISKGLEVTYLLAAHPETVTFTSEGDQVRIAGDVRDELLCDREELVTALLDCGGRYAAFKVAQLGPAAGDYYRKLLDRARDAVLQ